jgi:hypothetical protein
MNAVASVLQGWENYLPFMIVLPQISTSLEASEMPSVGKGLGVVTRLLKKWLRVQNSRCYKKGDRYFCFLLAHGRLD